MNPLFSSSHFVGPVGQPKKKNMIFMTFAFSFALCQTPSKATSSLQGVVPASTTTPTLPFPTLIVVGSAAIDITTRPTSLPILGSETTVPGSVDLTPGGVGLNVALCASRLVEGGSDRVMLIAPRGRDAFGRVLEGEMEGLGLRADGLVWGEGRTAVCSLVLDGQGSLEGGVADMEIVENLQGSEVRGSTRTHSFLDEDAN